MTDLRARIVDTLVQANLESGPLSWPMIADVLLSVPDIVIVDLSEATEYDPAYHRQHRRRTGLTQQNRNQDD